MNPVAQQIITIAVTLGIFVLIQVRRNIPLDLLFLCGLLIVSLCGVLTPNEAISGFANPAVLTIGALLALAAGLRICGVLDWIGEKLLGNVSTERPALWRLAIVLIGSSAFLLNTALVAMMTPVVSTWCRRHDISPSRLLIPVSYLTILGGVCTLIGTSTTLVVNARLQQSYADSIQQLEILEAEKLSFEERGMTVPPEIEPAINEQRKVIDSVRPLGLLELGRVGLPVAFAGGVFMLFVGPLLLPFRKQFAQDFSAQRREYLVEMKVMPNCPLIGKSIEDAKLRQLRGLFLIEIDRNGRVITPVAPNEVIEVDDHLIFTGIVETIVELEKIRGLVPTEMSSFEDQGQLKGNRYLTEVVLSPASPVIRQTARSSNFRERYNAAIIAVHRNGERMPSKIGDVKFRVGDTLLLQTTVGFASQYRNSREFYLISSLGETTRDANKKMPLASLIVAVLLVWLIIGSFFTDSAQAWASPAIAGLVAVCLFVITRCMTMTQVRTAVDVQLLVTIASALGLGLALEKSGAASLIANGIVMEISNPYVLLIAIYVLTMVLTEMITNTAVAALMFPIALKVAETGGYDPRPFIIAICLAASLAFVTPIGYQTNLMVMGPGGYRPWDYVKAGLPLAIITAIVAIALIPFMWPF